MASPCSLCLCSCYGSICSFEDSERGGLWVGLDKVVFRETDDRIDEVTATENDMAIWSKSDNPQSTALTYAYNASARQYRRANCVGGDKSFRGFVHIRFRHKHGKCIDSNAS